MHKRTRQVVRSFLSSFIAPDIVLDGADEEFRPYLEARVLEDESSGKGLLFIMNRSPEKSYSLKVSVKGFKTVHVEAPSYDVVRVVLTAAD
jgi:alpha-L-arabinofuranosidase